MSNPYRERIHGERVDVIVVGGGLTGLALAIAIGRVGARVAVIEAQTFETLVSAPHDGRVTAIALGSKRLLEGIGVWERMEGEAEAILDIEVGEPDSLGRVHYDHREIGDDPLGWIVENRVTRNALVDTVRGLETVRLIPSARVERIERDAGAVAVTTDSGEVLRGSLMAVCEGRQSSTRDRLGISARRWSYDQLGIVCTLRHEQPHGGLAVERFFPDGPFAMLPMRDNRSSIVWALETGLAKQVTALDDDAFVAEVSERFGDSLGRLSLEGRRWAYPLQLVWSDSYVAERVALVGDAARGIHPIAGQGWNLALRDVAALAEIIADRMRLGLDPGDGAALENYAAWRRFDGLALVAVTDGINRLFANDFTPLRLARETGLAVVDRLPPARRFFMRHAMGLVGDLPRLMRGEAL
ncbi:MAG: UbiH/UbiF/VisC/COQ6 family ubiquinone biosynthesis hydroxylase [Geminicoccaceae bacterium]|nr:UbiH/UbiF/VisC/COQ6 family ubiquinone biosynthesis hydroxylase [Geminicoccaceae bacterium]